MKNESRTPPESSSQTCAHCSDSTLDTVRRIENAFFDLSRPNTAPRRMLVEKLAELAKTGEAFSPDDLWQRLRAVYGKIGRATVYRSIEQLVENKVLDRVELCDGSHRYRVCGGSHHHHLVCTSCHRVEDFQDCLSEQKFEEIGRRHDFSVEDHRLTVYGTCRRCRRTADRR